MNPLKLLVIMILAMNFFLQHLLSEEGERQPGTKLGMTLDKSHSIKAKKGLEMEVRGFPDSLFFGDTFYHVCVVSNNTDKPVSFMDYNVEIKEGGRYMEGFRFVFSANNIAEQYDYVPELGDRYDRSPTRLTLAPGQVIKSVHPLELPPLEALEHPFWKQVLEKMTPEGIKCVLTVEIPKGYVDGNAELLPLAYIEFTFDILIKPRPPKEQALLEKWYQETPKQFFPPVSLTRVNDEKWWSTSEVVNFAKTGYHRCGGNYIVFGGEKYNPWCFIRERNRKPPAAICPTTIKGWKELEESLTPSTMRDEITFVRLQLELCESQGTKQDAILKSIVKWLESLPEPQRMSMASSFAESSPMGIFHDESDAAMMTRLGVSRGKLIRAILPMMSHYSFTQWHRIIHGATD